MLRNFHLWALFSVLFIPQFLNGFYKYHLTNPYVFWCEDALTFIFLPALSITYVCKNYGFSFRDFSLSAPLNSKFQQTNFSIQMVLIPVLLIGTYFLSRDLAKHLFSTNHFGVVYPKNYAGYTNDNPVYVAIYLAITAAITEEVFYRGILRKAISNVVLFIIISSLLFSIIHWEGGVWNLLPTFLFGLVASIPFLWHKTIYPQIMGHFLVNVAWFI